MIIMLQRREENEAKALWTLRLCGFLFWGRQSGRKTLSEKFTERQGETAPGQRRGVTLKQEKKVHREERQKVTSPLLPRQKSLWHGLGDLGAKLAQALAPLYQIAATSRQAMHHLIEGFLCCCHTLPK
jgi:hypothetical protein